MAGVTTTSFPYRIALKQPLRLASGWMRDREGFLVRLSNGAGHEGWGEASPLEGFSDETLDQVRRDLEGQADALSHGPSGAPSAIPSGAPSASVRFALELASLNLVATTSGVAPAVLLNPKAADSIRLNALVTDAKSAILAVDSGYDCLKLKVGRNSIVDDLARVRAVRDAVGPSVRIRLDANRAWSFEDALRFADGAALFGLDYIEEPLQEPLQEPPQEPQHERLDLAEFAFQTGLPVALDESVRRLTPNEIGAHRYAAAVVLKPTLLGGLRATRGYADAARNAGMRVVISSTFETGVGLRGLAALAAALDPVDGEQAGLGTAQLFEQDVTDPPFDAPGGRITGLRSLTPYSLTVGGHE